MAMCLFMLAITGCAQDRDAIVWEEIPSTEVSPGLQEEGADGDLPAGTGSSESDTGLARRGEAGSKDQTPADADSEVACAEASGAGAAGSAAGEAAAAVSERNAVNSGSMGCDASSGTGSSAGSVVGGSPETITSPTGPALTGSTIPKLTEAPDNETGLLEGESFRDFVEGKELLCLADSREEAESVAKLYGIELVEFSYGVASFHTTQDPPEVIRRGRENGWKPLDLNQIVYLDGER